jgi:hypothetical protein
MGMAFRAWYELVIVKSMHRREFWDDYLTKGMVADWRRSPWQMMRLAKFQKSRFPWAREIPLEELYRMHCQEY